jgi:putative redox protein
MKSRTRKCHFFNSRGQRLDARLDYPAATELDEVATFIVFRHCFTCSKETITTYRLSRLLAENGYAVLRFDFSGLGGSEGDFSSSTFSSTQDDLNCAIEFLSSNYRPPCYLMGHSLGGTTALAVAENFPHVKGVVTVASPSQPEHVLHHFGHALTLLEQGVSASFEVAGQFFSVEPAFVDDLRGTDMRTSLSTLDKPVLIIDIENDALVDESNAREIQHWLKGQSQLITIKNSDHLLTDKASVNAVAQSITGWLKNL